MQNKLISALKLNMEPVAIYFTDNKPENAFQFLEGKYGCVASILVLCATKGKTAVFDRKTYGCPGGGVGLCFGDTFSKTGHHTEYLLSTGDDGLAAHGKPPFGFGRGERFFNTPELAKKWKESFPYTDTGNTYTVFMPYSKASTAPDLICIFANPDQLSVLLIMSTAARGTAFNVLAPFSAACQSIVCAYNENKKERPKAVMGFFDLAQRHRVPKDILTFTLPYKMFNEMEKDTDESCLTTKAWERIINRQ